MPDEKKYNIHQYHLLKAEALCAELMSNGLSFDDFIIRFAGAFRKSFRNDIEKVVPAAGDGPLFIEINRDSLYDKLPEGLFHQTRGGSRTGSLSGMLGEHRRFREEEKQARKFFQPLEQELFRYAVDAEVEERKLLSGLLNGRLSKGFYEFWNVESGLPQEAAAVLVLVMPWIAQIKGDMRLTAKALSMMLARPVHCEQCFVEEQEEEGAAFCLGADTMLSTDTVCGSHFCEPCEQWVFTISDLAPEEAETFTAGNAYGRFLRRFEELFIPLDVDLKLAYHCRELPGEALAAPVLGYGFYL